MVAAPQPPAEPDPSVPIFSAEDEQGYEAHFHEHGYVIVGGVLGAERVDATVHELWESPSLLGGHGGLRRDDPATWDGESWPAGCRNFLDPLEPCAEAESWKNRLSPAVVRVFEVLWRGLGAEDAASADGRLVASVDRFGMMRPTWIRGDGIDAAPDPDAGAVERPDWRTSRNWLHWDQNPWTTPGFYGVQGLLALSDGAATSGGFVTVPGFHREFAQWCRDHPEGSIPKRTAATIPFPVPLEDPVQARRVKILVPRGGLLVWDSRMPHESFPNEDTSWRVVQYVTYKRLTPDDLRRRAAAWHAAIRTGLVPAAFACGFSPEEQAFLGMAALEEDVPLLKQAIDEGRSLSPEALEAVRKLRRAYRLKQSAIEPSELLEAKQLFQAAFAVNPELKLPLQKVGAAEDSYLPFWIL